jgi:hypothetical protein
LEQQPSQPLDGLLVVLLEQLFLLVTSKSQVAVVVVKVVAVRVVI